MAPPPGYLPPPPPLPAVDEPAAVRCARWFEAWAEATLRAVETQNSCFYMGIFQARVPATRCACDGRALRARALVGRLPRQRLRWRARAHLPDARGR